MKKQLTRILSLTLVFALLADPGVAVVTHLTFDPAGLPSHGTRMQEDALAARSLTVQHLILPFPRFLYKALKDFASSTHSVFAQHTWIPATPEGRTSLPQNIQLMESQDSDSGAPSPGGASPAASLSKNGIYTLRRPGALLLDKAYDWAAVPGVSTKLIPTILHYQDLHDRASAETTHQLTRTLRTSLQSEVSQIAKMPVKIFANESPEPSFQSFAEAEGYMPVLQIVDGEMILKEAVFAFGDRKSLSRLIGYGMAFHWLSRHPRFQRILTFMVSIGHHIPEETQKDFAAKLINEIPVFGFYARVYRQAEPLLRTPPVTADQIIETAGLSGPEADLVRQAYAYAGDSYKANGHDLMYETKKTYFSHRTATALDVAEYSQDPLLIAASLLMNLYKPDVGRWTEVPLNLCQNLQISLKSAEKIQKLILTANLLLATESFQTTTPPDDQNPSYLAENYSNRLIEAAGESGLPVGPLLILFLAEKAEWVTTLNAQQISPFNKETQYVNTFLSERFTGSGALTSRIENQTFKYHQREKYEKARQAFRKRLGKNHFQMMAALAKYSERAQQVIREKYQMDSQGTEREKTYARAANKAEEEVYDEKQGGGAARPIEEQPDLGAIRIVVKTPEQLSRFRHGLPAEIGTEESPTEVLPDYERVGRHKGQIVFHKTAFREVPSAANPNPMIIEIQMATPEGERIFVHGQAPNSYTLGHAPYKTKRNVNNLTGLGAETLDAFFRGEQFEHKDPPRTGHLEEDGAALRQAQAKWIYPRWAVSRMDPADLQSIDDFKRTDPIELPANATVGDLAFHRDVGQKPKHYWQPYRLTLVPDPLHASGYSIHRKKLALKAPLVPGDFIFFKEVEGDPLNYSDPGQETLYGQVRTAKAKLEMYPALPEANTPRLKLLADTGRTLFQMEYGDLNDPVIKRYALPAALYWLGLSEEELFQSFALSREGRERSRPVFKRVVEDFDKWYKARFVTIKYKVNDFGEMVNVTADIDEDQAGQLADLMRFVQDRGLKVVRSSLARSVHAQPKTISLFTLRPSHQEFNPTDLEQQLKSLRRRRGERRPADDSERIVIRLPLPDRTKDDSVLYTAAQRLSDLNVSIESTDSHTKRQGGGTLILSVRAPQTFKKYPNEPIETVLKKRLGSEEGPPIELEPEAYSEATVAEINSFLISEAQQLDKKFWKYLPFNPEDKELLRTLAIKQPGTVDEVAVARFKKMWQIARDYHPEHDNAWATQHLRKNDAPYWVHPLGIAWEVLNTGMSASGQGKIRDPIVVLAAIGHDLLEDGVAHAMTRQGLNDRRARAQIFKRIDAAMPSYMATLVKDTIRELTRNGDSYEQYMKRLLKSGSLRAILVKFFDQKNNLIDPSPRRIARSIRYFLPFTTLTEHEGFAVFQEARGALFEAIFKLILETGTLETFKESGETDVKATAATYISADDFYQWISRDKNREDLLYGMKLNSRLFNTAVRKLDVFAGELLGELLRLDPRFNPRSSPGNSNQHAVFPLLLTPAMIHALAPFFLAASHLIPYTLLALPWISAFARMLATPRFSKEAVPFLRAA